MGIIRRRYRNFIGRLAGAQANLEIWWPPELPIVYISNPKSGCSTIKHSLKAVQADLFQRSGRAFERSEDPHTGDDCLFKRGLDPASGRQRYVISCVRNPFTRALSGFLDKASHPDAPLLQEFDFQRVDDFESFLRQIAEHDPSTVNSHFRPQHINLDYPRINYDAIFFLENLAALQRYLSPLCPAFELETFAPHSRGAGKRLHEHYTERTIDMVRNLFAKDFELFGYSRNLDDAAAAPGAKIVGGRIHASCEVRASRPPRPAEHGKTFDRNLRFRRLVDLRLI